MSSKPDSSLPYEAVLSKAIDLAKPLVETGCNLFNALLGKPCGVAGEMLADQLYAWQWGNRIRIANRTKRIMRERGIEARVVPPGFLMPLLEACGNTEEPDVQEMWASLLASAAASDDHAKRLHVECLRRLESIDSTTLLRVARDEVVDLRAASSDDIDLSSINRLVALGLVSWILPRFDVVIDVIDGGGAADRFGTSQVEAKPKHGLGEVVELSPYAIEFLAATTSCKKS